MVNKQTSIHTTWYKYYQVFFQLTNLAFSCHRFLRSGYQVVFLSTLVFHRFIMDALGDAAGRRRQGWQELASQVNGKQLRAIGRRHRPGAALYCVEHLQPLSDPATGMMMIFPAEGL